MNERHKSGMAAESHDGWWPLHCETEGCRWNVEVDVHDAAGMPEALRRVFAVRDDHDHGIERDYAWKIRETRSGSARASGGAS